MTEIEKRMAAALGLTEDDFTPKPTPEERLAELESAVDNLIIAALEVSADV